MSKEQSNRLVHILTGRNWGGAREGAGRPKSLNSKSVVSISLRPKLIDAIDLVAMRAGRSRSAQIQAILDEWERQGDH